MAGEAGERFQVTRTSGSFDDEESPCEEAYRGQIMLIDERTVNDAAQITADKNLGADEARRRWFAVGTNHRVVDGHIIRDMGMCDVWFVDIADLAALKAFQERYGELVLRTSWMDGQTSCIEIYDDYRE